MVQRGGCGYINISDQNAILEGAEVSVDVEIIPRFQAQASMSYVKGTLTDTESPLERIPPLNGKVALLYVAQPLKVAHHGAIFRWTNTDSAILKM